LPPAGARQRNTPKQLTIDCNCALSVSSPTDSQRDNLHVQWAATLRSWANYIATPPSSHVSRIPDLDIDILCQGLAIDVYAEPNLAQRLN
jgi:hypothetical protein